MSDIKKYDEMNKQIYELVRMAGDSVCADLSVRLEILNVALRISDEIGNRAQAEKYVLLDKRG